MKKLQSLKLKNFCSYDYAEIEFGDATCFQGHNGSGKSNILLALITGLFNLDFTADYIRNGQKEASIEITFTDGSSLYRERQKTKQKIILTDDKGRTTNFSSSKCTEQVRDFTGFHQVQLDKNASSEYLQWVPVKSPQFLLDKSPEVVLRMLSALLSGQGIELVKTDIQSELRTLQTDEKHLIEQTGKSQANVEYLVSPTVEKAYEEASVLLQEFDEIETEESEVVELIKLKTLLERSFSDDEEQFVAEVFSDAHECSATLLGLKALEQELQELECLEIDLDNAKQQRGYLLNEIEEIDEELKIVGKELQEYKCKQCGKLVKELCLTGCND